MENNIFRSEVNDNLIQETLEEFGKNDNNELNDTILKLFKTFNNYSDGHEVRIKASALNKIYSTSIIHLEPVIEIILEEINFNTENYCEEDFAKLVDKISNVSWTDKEGKIYHRKYLSFSSKYIHFLSGFKTPIFDSCIFLMIKKYQKLNGKKIPYSNPKTYLEFYKMFGEFKIDFKLENIQIMKLINFYGS
jgi:hypothetical protein